MTLVPTLVPEINVHQIGAIINYGISMSPWVRGIHFQPVSFFGRIPQMPSDRMRLTLDQLMAEIETQTGAGSQNSTCSAPGSTTRCANSTGISWSCRTASCPCHIPGTCPGNAVTPLSLWIRTGLYHPAVAAPGNDSAVAGRLYVFQVRSVFRKQRPPQLLHLRHSDPAP